MTKILTTEGTIQYNKDRSYYGYFVKDHLGNNKVLVQAGAGDKTLSASMITHYYPFGMEFSSKINGDVYSSISNPYRYNGKELDQMHGLNWLDYGARWYDPTIAKWNAVDPLGEKYYSITPYAYCANNPVNAIDPDGREWKITSSTDKNGVLNIHITVTDVVYNNSSSSINMSKLTGDIKKQIEKVFSFSGKGFNVTTSADLRTVSSVNDISKSDHVFQVVDQSTFKNGATLADSEVNGLNIRIGTDLSKDIMSGENTRTAAHELGHSGGLYDANLNNNLNVDPNKNLLTQMRYLQNNYINPNSATRVEVSQLNSIIKSYNAGLLNQNSPISSTIRMGFLPNKLTIPLIYLYKTNTLR